MPYRKVISLGMACDVTSQIRRISKQTEAYPFDWLITPYKSLVSIIDSDFNNFLLSNYIEPYKKGVIDNYSGAIFLHEFENNESFMDTYAAVKEKYDRRIERFRQELEAPGSILFVRGQQYANEDVVDELKARTLIALLREKYPVPNIDLIVNNPNEAAIPELIDNGLYLMPIEAPKPFNWRGDPLAWEKLFLRVLNEKKCPP